MAQFFLTGTNASFGLQAGKGPDSESLSGMWHVFSEGDTYVLWFAGRKRFLIPSRCLACGMFFFLKGAYTCFGLQAWKIPDSESGSGM